MPGTTTALGTTTATSALPGTLRADVLAAYDLPPDTDVAGLAEPLRTYVDYALQTVDRGRQALRELDLAVDGVGFRFLDVGCAYGGFLHAALEAGASRAVGTEVDERFRRVAEAVARAHGERCRVTDTDLCDPAAMAELGQFEAIVCADVLEHVSDPATAVRNLVAALAPDGQVHAAVPSATALANVHSDPHFQLLGITLLDPPEARAHYADTTGSQYYDVGSYLTAGGYVRLFEAAGGRAWLTNAPDEPAVLLAETRRDGLRVLRRLVRERQRLRRTPTGRLIARRAAVHVLRFLVLHSAWLLAARSPTRFSTRLGDHLCVAYGIKTWHFRAGRPA